MENQPNADSNKENVVPTWIPRVGMIFSTLVEAWKFWGYYGGRTGFSIRQRCKNKSKFDGKFTSCKLVCSKEGKKLVDKRDPIVKNPRAETRTGCPVRMILSFNRETEIWAISEIFLEHNHILQLPEACHLLPSQRMISEVQAFEIEIADDSGIAPKLAHEFASRRVGGTSNLSYTPLDHRNHLRTKRQRDLKYGEAGSMLKYFQDKAAKNPSFKHDFQFDCEEKITNIFWADAKMIIDYAHFGDVMTFDTTFGTNKENRPFGVFVGFNHFRETVIFGACLLYDETYESFKWLFATFLSIHNQKQPRTIYTDQDQAMGKAVGHVFIEAKHGLCTFHIMQNAVKHLSSYMEEESTLLADFSACMYEHWHQETFEEAFQNMRGQVPTQTWMDSIYKVKEKWAECFMKNAFTLGMRSTQLSESLNNDLKHHLKSNLDIVRFFQHFERAVKVKRDVEVNSEFNSRMYLPKIRMDTPILVQVGKLYTPVIFEFFQKEYRRSLGACAEALDEPTEYMVKIGYPFEQPRFQEEWKVKGNRLEQIASCDCGQFERLGVLCAHALKVLDLMNVKLLPEHYILKRWTREARAGVVQDSHGRIVVADPKIDALHRTNFLSHKFYDLVTEASNSEECCTLIENTLDNLSKEVKGVLLNAQVTTPASNNLLNAQVTTHEAQNDSLADARLKKKEVNKQDKGSKRRKPWYERQYKAKKIGPDTTTAPLSKGKKRAKKGPKTKENHLAEPTLHEDSHGYESITNFTQLLNMPSFGPSIGDDIF